MPFSNFFTTNPNKVSPAFTSSREEKILISVKRVGLMVTVTLFYYSSIESILTLNLLPTLNLGGTANG